MKPNIQRRFWLAPRGWFHWINVFCFTLLLFTGLVIMWRIELGLEGADVKIALKRIHAVIGYVFAINLFLWATQNFGRLIQKNDKSFANLKNLLLYPSRLSVSKSLPTSDVARVSRTLVFVIVVSLVTQVVTGLIRAGTDLYYPPFGGFVAEYVADSPKSVALLKPQDDSHTNRTRYKRVSQAKLPLGKIHIYNAYLLLLLGTLHIRIASDLSRVKRPTQPELTENNG